MQFIFFDPQITTKFDLLDSLSRKSWMGYYTDFICLVTIVFKEQDSFMSVRN